MGNRQKDESQIDVNQQTDSDYTSPYLRLYRSFMNSEKMPVSLIQYSQALQKHKINYDQNKFCPQPNIIFLSQTTNFQALTLGISFSYFAFQISLLNLNQKSRAQYQLKVLGSGSMGNIVSFPLYNKKTVIKYIPYNHTDQVYFHQILKQKCLEQAILQCCFTKLFSALEIGPKFLTPYGFDIVVFEQTVEFGMEQCQKFHFDLFDKQIQYFVNSLKLMHSLHLIHGDIKPQNIMWSPSYKKCVLIDFGLSKIVKEDIGHLSYTLYFGSYLFTLPQMKHLFIKKSFGYVDLYYNDVHALKIIKSKNIQQTQIQNQRRIKCIQEVVISQSFINEILNYKLQYLIYSRKFDEVLILIQENKNMSLYDSTLQILLQIPPTITLQKTVKSILKTFNLRGVLVEKIEAFFQRKIYKPIIDSQKNRIFSKRIKQICRNQNATLNQVIIFLKLLFNQDLTPKALMRKKQIFNQIRVQHQRRKLFKQKIKISFWESLIQFVENLYSTQKQIIEAFQMIKDILQIKKWNFFPCKYYVNQDIFQKAKQISESVYHNYKIKLFNLKQYQQNSIKKVKGHKFDVKRNYLNNIKQSQFSLGFPGKQVYDEFFRFLNNQKNQFMSITDLIQNLKTKFDENKNKGVYLLLILISNQKQFENLDQDNIQKQKIFNQFSKYTVTLKCRILIEKLMSNFQNIKIVRDIQTVIKQLQIFIKTAYNYCFKIDVATFVMINNQFTLNLLDNYKNISNLKNLTQTLNKIQKCYQQVGVVPPMSQIGKILMKTIQIIVNQCLKWQAPTKNISLQEIYQNNQKKGAKLIQQILNWYCKLWNKILNKNQNISHLQLIQFIFFLVDMFIIIGEIENYLQKFQQVKKSKCLIFKFLFQNNLFPYEEFNLQLTIFKILLQKKLRQISLIQYYNKLIQIQNQLKEILTSRQFFVFEQIVSISYSLQKSIQPYFSKIIQYYKKDKNYYRKTLANLNVLFSAAREWCFQERVGVIKSFDFLIQLASKAQQIQNNQSNFSMYEVTKSFVDFLRRKNYIRQICYIFFQKIQQQFKIIGQNKCYQKVKNLSLLLPPQFKIYYVDCKTEDDRLKVKLIIKNIIKYIYLWSSLSPSFFVSRINIRYYHYLLKFIKHGLITDDKQINLNQNSNQKIQKKEKQSKSSFMDINIYKKYLYLRRQIKNPSTFAQDQQIDSICHKIDKYSQKNKSRKIFLAIKKKLINFNNNKKLQVTINNHIQLRLCHRNYFSVLMNQKV